MPRTRPAHLLTAAILALTPFAHADETYIGTNTGWFFNSSWSNNAVPTSADNVFVTPTLPSGTNTLTANNTISTANLTIGASGGGTAILATQIGGDISNMTILSTGQFNAGGSFQTNSILNQGLFTNYLDTFSTSGGTFFLRANSTLTNHGTISTQGGGILQFWGNGTLLDNSNGTIDANDYNANNSASGSVTFYNLNISGGQLSASQYNRITLSGGSLSNATVNGDLQFSGGSSVLIANDTINGNLSSNGGQPAAPVIFAGSVKITGAWSPLLVQISGPVSFDGTGTFNLGLLPGTIPNLSASTPDASLSIASTQTLNLSAFVASMPITNNGTILGNSTFYVAPADANGTPPFINRGTLTASGLLGANGTIGSIDNANGTISITGYKGTTHNPNTTAIQNVSVNGGTLSTDAKAQIQFNLADTLSNLTMSGNFVVVKYPGSSLTLSNVTLNGTLTANSNLTSTTPLTGTGSLILAANASLSSGPLQLTAASFAGTAQIRPNTGTSILNALTITGSLDLTTNPLILTDPTASPAIQADIAAHSLFSSTAPLVFIDNSLRATPYTTFAGQSVNANSLLIAPAEPGDATLDGSVDLNDLNTVLNHLGETSSAWSAGNFDGASTIDLNDLNAVLNNLGTSDFSSPTAQSAESLLPASAPEPASLALLAPFALLLTPRRNARHH